MAPSHDEISPNTSLFKWRNTEVEKGSSVLDLFLGQGPVVGRRKTASSLPTQGSRAHPRKGNDLTTAQLEKIWTFCRTQTDGPGSNSHVTGLPYQHDVCFICMGHIAPAVGHISPLSHLLCSKHGQTRMPATLCLSPTLPRATPSGGG